jgi:hypothetical protein
MDLPAWLRGLGLERYEPLFRDHEIDWKGCRKLTSEDLKEIGGRSVSAARRSAVPMTLRSRRERLPVSRLRLTRNRPSTPI